MATEEMRCTLWRENPADHCHDTREEAHGGCPGVCRGRFPGGLVVKSTPANAGDIGDVGSIPGLGRSPGVGNGKLLQYSCLGNFRGGKWIEDLQGHSLWGHKELDMTEHTHT